jgi:flagellar hook-basal body complex protein FliE
MTSFDLQGLTGLGAGVGPASGRPVRQQPLVGELAPIQGGSDIEPGRTGAAPDFGGAMAAAIDRVDSLQRDVQTKVQELASGQPVALHDIMMSMGKSEIAFNLMLEVRNKLVDAWEKLSRSVV